MKIFQLNFIRCPAVKINDPKGTDLVPNVIFVMKPLRDVVLEGGRGTHTLLEAVTTRRIRSGDELFLSYGDDWWNEKGAMAVVRAPPKVVQVENESSDDDVADDNEELAPLFRIEQDLTRKLTRSRQERRPALSDELTRTAALQA